MSLSRYSEFRNEYDELLAHAINVLDAQAGYAVQSERENYGEKIFGKLICHAISLQRLMPNKNPTEYSQIWDVSSAYALSRAILESYEAFAYIATEKLSEAELECRVLAWKLHAQERRLKMLTLIGSQSPDIKEVERSIRELKDAVFSPFYAPFISKENRGKIDKGDTPPYLTPRSKRLLAARVNAEYFKVALMHLSSHVHTHPFSLDQLFEFKAATPEAYLLMQVGGQYACGFLSAAVRDMSALFSPRIPAIPTRVQQTLELCCETLEKQSQALLIS